MLSSENDRLLVAEWILGGQDTLQLPNLAAALYPFRSHFYPTVFDSLRIKQMKLYPSHLTLGPGWLGN